MSVVYLCVSIKNIVKLRDEDTIFIFIKVQFSHTH